MQTIEMTVVVNPDHTVTLTLPVDIAPGIRDVVIVLGDPLPAADRSLFAGMPAFDLKLVDPDATFRQEEIYGDDGR